MDDAGPTIAHAKALIEHLDAESRLRLRAWMGSAFDGCGQPRETNGDANRSDRVYRLEDFEYEDMRELQRLSAWNFRRTAWNVPGIYAIASRRDWLYVGRAVKLSIRRTTHASTLRNGTHPNLLLQRHWDRDQDALWFVVLERCEVRSRHGGEHPQELVWKKRLRPLYDREGRKSDISFLIHPSIADTHYATRRSGSGAT